MPPSDPPSERTCLRDQIVDRFVQFCTAVFAVERESWLSVELTMPQVKTLLLIVTWGRTTGSRLASALGAGLPSVTRLVDRLEDQGYVERATDDADRRVTYIVPTTAGQRLIEGLLTYKRDALGSCLEEMATSQLQQIATALEILLDSAGQRRILHEDQDSREPVRHG
jgi:DNA-binding MarR family transcriptional regulator